MYYADSAATTPLAPVAQAAMAQAFATWGNPGSRHQAGQAAAQVIDQAVQSIADVLGCATQQIVLTHGGTDANRRVLRFAERQWGRATTFCSAIEHSSVLDEVLPGNQFDAWSAAGLRPSARLVALMHANNETGVVLSSEIVRAKAPNALLLRDWVQSAAKVPIDLADCDVASFSAHKFGGPKGVGFLYFRAPEAWGALTRDTHTKDPIAVAGMAAVVGALASPSVLRPLTQHLEQQLRQHLPDIKIHHADQPRVPGITSVAIRGVRGSALAEVLSAQEGICVSTGSACSSDLLTPTHVIAAIESDPAWQFPIRLGLLPTHTRDDITHIGEAIAHYAATLKTN